MVRSLNTSRIFKNQLGRAEGVCDRSSYLFAAAISFMQALILFQPPRCKNVLTTFLMIIFCILSQIKKVQDTAKAVPENNLKCFLSYVEDNSYFFNIHELCQAALPKDPIILIYMNLKCVPHTQSSVILVPWQRNLDAWATVGL